MAQLFFFPFFFYILFLDIFFFLKMIMEGLGLMVKDRIFGRWIPMFRPVCYYCVFCL